MNTSSQEENIIIRNSVANFFIIVRLKVNQEGKDKRVIS
jgi:hypothetical protein